MRFALRMAIWIDNTSRYSSAAWFERGVVRQGDSGGLQFASFLNLDTASEIVLYPTTGYKDSDAESAPNPREYRVWLLPPGGGAAVEIQLREASGSRMSGTFTYRGGWEETFGKMHSAITTMLQIS